MFRLFCKKKLKDIQEHITQHTSQPTLHGSGGVGNGSSNCWAAGTVCCTVQLSAAPAYHLNTCMNELGKDLADCAEVSARMYNMI